MPKPAAILFDLYGTLLEADPRAVHREIPRALGVSPRRWLQFVRNDLLVRRFDDPAAFARHICDELAPGHPGSMEGECIAILDRALREVRPKEGVHSLLAFLRRRGFRTGLLSNLSSSYKQPLHRLGLEESFDAMVFSCDEGRAKPDEAVYRVLLERLGAGATDAWFVGDSLANDVEAPRRLGMRGIHVGSCAADHECVSDVSDLGWFDFDGGPGDRMLAPGRRFDFAGRLLTVETLTPVADDEQGRYNLVYRAVARDEDGGSRTLYCKRFLLPESAWVEELAHRIHSQIGLPACEAAVIDDGAEPFLVLSEAPGVKGESSLDRDLAYEIGRHHVFAFLFSNADMRPRNAFVARGGDVPVMTMIDLEHCFFNLAIDVEGIERPEDPASFDGMPPEELRRRTAKKVLSERAMRRARKTFIETESCAPDLREAFRAGFVDQFLRVRNGRDALLTMMRERLARPPFLVIGTHSYRRAMSRVDVDDIAERLELEPEAALALFT